MYYVGIWQANGEINYIANWPQSRFIIGYICITHCPGIWQQGTIMIMIFHLGRYNQMYQCITENN